MHRSVQAARDNLIPALLGRGVLPERTRLRKAPGPARTMDFKKITRNPLVYVLLIGVFLIVGFSLISSLGAAKQISTQ
jgi:hypothetical protein